MFDYCFLVSFSMSYQNLFTTGCRDQTLGPRVSHELEMGAEGTWEDDLENFFRHDA